PDRRTTGNIQPTVAAARGIAHRVSRTSGFACRHGLAWSVGAGRYCGARAGRRTAGQHLTRSAAGRSAEPAAPGCPPLLATGARLDGNHRAALLRHVWPARLADE